MKANRDQHRISFYLGWSLDHFLVVIESMKHYMNFEHFCNAKLKQIRLDNASFEKHIQMLYINVELFLKHTGMCIFCYLLIILVVYFPFEIWLHILEVCFVSILSYSGFYWSANYLPWKFFMGFWWNCLSCRSFVTITTKTTQVFILRHTVVFNSQFQFILCPDILHIFWAFETLNCGVRG